MEMMKCKHNIDLDVDDENFLLDDENTNCETCKKDISSWTGLSNNNVLQGITGGNFRGRLAILDDCVDMPEDAPLLINTPDAEPYEEFHCHDVIYRKVDEDAWTKLISASVFCFIFMLAELVGGYFAGSLAIMTDSAHLFSDFIGFMISLVSIWFGKKPPTKMMTFGYDRAEVFGALISVMTIWILTIVFSILAIHRIWKNEYEIQGDTMIITASLGLGVNIIMGAILHGVCHRHLGNHSHSHSHHSHNDMNINVRAAVIHVLGDLLQSIGVLIAAVVIKLRPDAKIADPICTLIFSLIIVCTTYKVAKDSVWFLLEGSPVNSKVMASKLKGLANVKHLHSLNIWSLAPGRDIVAVHLAVDRFCDRDVVLKEATTVIKSQLDVVSCTIQVEAYNALLTESCKHCQLMNS